MIREFKLRSSAFIESPPHFEIEWLFIMQHHDLATRLLDWSESSLAALYFAVCDFESKSDAAVWTLDPWSLNESVFAETTVPPANHPIVLKYVLDPNPELISRKVEGDFPIAIRPRRTTSRITAQRGVFTIHGKSPQPLNQYANTKPKVLLDKIVIDGSKKKDIFRELFLAGVTQSVMFPDIVGLAREIGVRYSNSFMT